MTSPRVDPFVQLALVDDAIDDLAGADLEGVSDEWFARYARSVDEVRSRCDAVGVAVAAEAERRGHGRAPKGFLSTKSWIKHHVQLTGSEAHGRDGFTARRQADGEWIIRNTDGEPIG